jgi:hypothetical protein
MHLKCIELVNSILFVLPIIGHTLLILSGYLITQCGNIWLSSLSAVC